MELPWHTRYTIYQGSENPGIFKKAQPGWVFGVLLGFGFYWGFFGRAVPAAVEVNMEKEND